MNVLSLDIGLATGVVYGSITPRGPKILDSLTLRVSTPQLSEAFKELSPIIRYMEWFAEENPVDYILYEPPLKQPNYRVSKVLTLVATTWESLVRDYPRVYPERKVLIRPSQWKPVVSRSLDLYGGLSEKFRPTPHEKDASKILWYWWKYQSQTST